MTEETIPTEDATRWLVQGLRELAYLLDDGVAEQIHFEHYSETSTTGKKYHLHLEYRKPEPEALTSTSAEIAAVDAARKTA